MTIRDTQTVATYFRGNPKFGRTTALIVTETGEVLLSVMGAATRKDLWAQYQRQQVADTNRVFTSAELLALGLL